MINRIIDANIIRTLVGRDLSPTKNYIQDERYKGVIDLETMIVEALEEEPEVTFEKGHFTTELEKDIKTLVDKFISFIILEKNLYVKPEDRELYLRNLFSSKTRTVDSIQMLKLMKEELQYLIYLEESVSLQQLKQLPELQKEYYTSRLKTCPPRRSFRKPLFHRKLDSQKLTPEVLNPWLY